MAAAGRVAARRTRARSGRRRLAARPRFAVAALATAAAGIALVWVLTSWSGQALLVGAGIREPFLARLADHLDVALGERFLDLGLLRSDLRERRVAVNGSELREYSFRTPPHLTPTLCNLWITRAACAARARVLRAEEQPRRGGEVVLQLGFGSHVTHRIVAMPPSPPAAVHEPTQPRIALVIDDLGQSMNATTRGVFELGFPLTVAVLPDLPQSDDAFRVAERHGVPALLHLPMEPDGDLDPGRNPLRVGMSELEIQALLDKHRRRYPTFIGVNNHMGSRATADLPTMRAFAAVLGRRELFFVDSQTTPHSVGYQASREQGVWSIRNDLFVDDGTRSAETVAQKLRELAELARARGLAVGIAHARPYTLQALRAQLPRLQSEGIAFVSLAELRKGGRKPREVAS